MSSSLCYDNLFTRFLTLSMILRTIQKVMKAYTSQQFFRSVMIEYALWWNMFHGNTITPHYCKSSSHLWLELTSIFYAAGIVTAQNNQSWAASIIHCTEPHYCLKVLILSAFQGQHSTIFMSGCSVRDKIPIIVLD